MTPDEARDLLSDATPGPWRLQEVKGHPHLRYIASGTGHSGDPTAAVCIPVDVTSREGAANMALKAAAPTLAAMIAGMREEWGVSYRWANDDTALIEWGSDTREEAVKWARKMENYPGSRAYVFGVVRRYVTEPEEIE